MIDITLSKPLDITVKLTNQLDQLKLVASVLRLILKIEHFRTLYNDFNETISLFNIAIQSY